MANVRVPGIGFVGLGQMDPASQLVYSKAMGRNGGRTTQKRRRSTRKKTHTRARRIPGKGRTRNTRGASMVKGSAAAKRHMAKLRKMRKR